MIKNRSRKKTNKGVTLPELLVAFAIFILGVIPIMGLMSAATRNHTRSTHNVRTGLLARLILDELQSSGRTDFFKGNVKDQAHRDYPNYGFDIEFTPLGPNQEAVLAKVDVYLQSNKNEILKSMVSIVRKKPENLPATN